MRTEDRSFYVDRFWVAAPLVLLALAVLVFADAATNRATFLALHQVCWGIPGWILQSVTFLGDTVPAVVIMLFFARRHPQLVWAAVLAAVVGTLYTHSLKPFFDAPRPPLVLDAESLRVVGHVLRRQSFPSGHSLTAFTVAGIIVFGFRQTWVRVLALTAGSLVALSRIGVGVHWPVDVAAGAFGGWLSAWLGVLGARRWGWGLTLRGRQILVGLLMVAAAYLFVHDGGYPQATWLAWGLGVAGIVVGALTLRALIRGEPESPPAPAPGTDQA